MLWHCLRQCVATGLQLVLNRWNCAHSKLRHLFSILTTTESIEYSCLRWTWNVFSCHAHHSLTSNISSKTSQRAPCLLLWSSALGTSAQGWASGTHHQDKIQLSIVLKSSGTINGICHTIWIWAFGICYLVVFWSNYWVYPCCERPTCGINSLQSNKPVMTMELGWQHCSAAWLASDGNLDHIDQKGTTLENKKRKHQYFAIGFNCYIIFWKCVVKRFFCSSQQWPDHPIINRPFLPR